MIAVANRARVVALHQSLHGGARHGTLVPLGVDEARGARRLACPAYQPVSLVPTGGGRLVRACLRIRHRCLLDPGRRGLPGVLFIGSWDQK
jgi:hypothetical protein